MATRQEFERLLNLNDTELEREVVGAVSGNNQLMSLAMPQAIPAMSVDDYVRNASYGELRNSVLEYIKLDFEKTQRDLYELICVKLDYCKAKKKRADLIALLEAIVKHYVALAVVAAHPHCWILAPVAVYLAKKYLDKLCKCNEK